MKHPSVIYITPLCDTHGMPPAPPARCGGGWNHDSDASEGLGLTSQHRAGGTAAFAFGSATQGHFAHLLILPEVIGVTPVT